MPLIVKDRVQETSTTTGTGTFTLAGAVSGFATFSSAVGNGNTTYYAIVGGTEWEVGIGTVAAGTLARTTLLASSTGSAISFSAGIKNVFCTYPADKSVTIDDIQTLTNKTINLASNTLTGTTAQFNTALSDGDFATLAGTETLTNKALNGTLGATTPSTVAATTISASGISTFSAGSAAAPAITTAGDTNTGVFFPVADTIAFAEGGVEAMRIDSSGNLLINTSSVADPAGWGKLVQLYGTSYAAFSIKTAASQWDIANYANALTFYNGATERMRIDSSGNVGVGVTPSAWSSIKALQVVNASFGGLGNGNYSASNAYYDGANWKYITSNYATLYQQSGNAGDGTHKWSTAPSGTAGNTISFTTAMTLDANGNLGIGTASAGSMFMYNYAASTIGTRLGANPSDQGFQIGTRNGVAGAGSGTEIARLRWGYGGADSAYISAERNGGTGANRINVVCNMSAGVFLAAGGTSWGSLSDERQKTNLEPITDASNKLNTLRTVTGRYITDEETISRAFLIAQDVQAVLPEAVDAQEDEEGTLGLRYTDLIPLLVAGFKEQQIAIQELKDIVNNQVEQIKALETQLGVK
jgi:hypothetical protein